MTMSPHPHPRDRPLREEEDWRQNMRRARIKLPGEGFYHVMSRIVRREFWIDDEEKRHLLAEIRRAAAFSGVELYTYALMDNHFHLLVRVPAKRDVDDTELHRRMVFLYGLKRTDALFSTWSAWEQKDLSGPSAHPPPPSHQSMIFPVSSCRHGCFSTNPPTHGWISRQTSATPGTPWHWHPRLDSSSHGKRGIPHGSIRIPGTDVPSNSAKCKGWGRLAQTERWHTNKPPCQAKSRHQSKWPNSCEMAAAERRLRLSAAAGSELNRSSQI